MFTINILYKFKKRIFASKLIRNIQTFITKNVLKIFQIFFSLQCTGCGNRRKFHADRRILKHCKKSAKMSDSFPTRRRERVKWIFRTVDVYYLLYIYCTVYSAFWLTSVFFLMFSQLFSSNVRFSLSFSSTVLFNHCSIIVRLFFYYCSVLYVFLLFRSCYQQPSTKSINIIKEQDSPTFVLA